MTQCLGRLVKDNDGVDRFTFEQGGLFHIPLRCERIARAGELCDSCFTKQEKTLKKVQEIRGSRINGTHPSFLMGKITDPIPYWSRIYDGAWFRLKMESGCTISANDMPRIRKAVEKAYEGVPAVEPQPMPGEVKPSPKKGAPKKVAEPVAAPPKKRIVIKKPEGAPVAQVLSEVAEAETIMTISVRKQEVDGRMFYLDPKKDKLYDMKFKYIGRFKKDAIVAHPDSDAE